MYVMQAEVTAGDFDAIFDVTGTAGNQIVTLPADRCAWTYNGVATHGYQSATGQYELSSAAFVMGNGTNISLINPVLGSIGKSGRFVPSTV